MGMLRLGKILLNWNGDIFAKNSHSWVSFGCFTEVPISVISFNYNGSFFPSFLSNFGLVYTENIRFWSFQVVFQVLFSQDGSNAVNVPRANEEFVRGFAISILPVTLVRFAMDYVRTIIELFGSGFGNGFFIFNDFLGE